MYRSTFHYTRPYLLLLFSLSSFFLLAQKPAQLDSLQQVLAQSVDTSKVKALINIAYAWERIDPTKGLPYSQQAIGLAQEINYEKGLGDAYYAAGYLYHLKDDHPKAEKLYSQAVSVYQDINDEKKLSECYGRLGHLYTLRAEYQRSLEIYEKALEITKRTKDNRNASIIIFSMANSYAYIGESQKAFQLLKECKPLIVHRPHLINYYAILADLYRGTGNHEKSLASFSEAINICEEFGDTLRMAYVSEAIARTYSELGQYENGAAYYFKTIALNEKIASPVLTIVSYLGLGDLYRLWKDPKKSIEFYQQARIMIDSNQIMEKLPVFHLGMGQSYSDLKAYPLALQHFEQALTVAEESQLLEEMIKARI
ncbi:MAG: tetratricopeptide repeat protein, partial [Bacteroidota bacterium]